MCKKLKIIKFKYYMKKLLAIGVFAFVLTFVGASSASAEVGYGGGGGSGGGSSSGGSTGGGSVLPTRGSVLGASTDTGTSTVNNQACTILLTKFMRRGQKNDTEEVKKLQTFLNSQNLGITLPVTGFFGAQTESAVKLLQNKHAADVLTPWGLTAPTGHVYKTTLRWINHLQCMKAPLPPLSL